MDASKLYKVAGCKQGDAFPYARGSPPYRVYKCLRPLPRAYPLPDRAFGESPHRRNRGRVCGLCGLVDYPCSASWFVCFPVLLWGRAKPLEEHYYALRTTICVCAIPASTAYADCTTGAYSKLGSSGSTSYYACNATRNPNEDLRVYRYRRRWRWGLYRLGTRGFLPRWRDYQKAKRLQGIFLYPRFYLGLVTPSWCARHIAMLRQKVNQLQQLQHAVQP